MAKMTWNAKTGEYEGETEQYYVYVDADEMAETVADAEKQGYNPDEMPEFSAESWVELGMAGNSLVKVIRKNWGGPREGAGRPKGTAKGTTYQEGYNAGYQAGQRKPLRSQVMHEQVLSLVHKLHYKVISTNGAYFMVIETPTMHQIGYPTMQIALHELRADWRRLSPRREEPC